MSKKYVKKSQSNSMYPIFIAVLIVVLVIVVIWLISLTGNNHSDSETTPENELPTVNLFPNEESEEYDDSSLEEEESSTQFIQAEIEEIDPMDLGNGLIIDSIGNYTGVYMEDGTDKVVSRVMMLILKNESEQDLQYAEINLEYSTFTADFQVTSIPAGESVVLLEKNRHSATEEKPVSATATNVSFFQESMSLYEDKLQITGLDGALNVKNISNEDISGDFYIYYKNSATDIYYGGITYRAKVEGGLKAGEIKQVMTNHYSPKGCTLIMVTGVE